MLLQAIMFVENLVSLSPQHVEGLPLSWALTQMFLNLPTTYFAMQSREPSCLDNVFELSFKFARILH